MAHVTRTNVACVRVRSETDRRVWGLLYSKWLPLSCMCACRRRRRRRTDSHVYRFLNVCACVCACVRACVCVVAVAARRLPVDRYYELLVFLWSCEVANKTTTKLAWLFVSHSQRTTPEPHTQNAKSTHAKTPAEYDEGDFYLLVVVFS